ncbi:uncharacterized protein LOC135922043 isoform X2 [Gordionus sp. m RMFG-2023]
MLIMLVTSAQGMYHYPYLLDPDDFDQNNIDEVSKINKIRQDFNNPTFPLLYPKYDVNVKNTMKRNWNDLEMKKMALGKHPDKITTKRKVTCVENFDLGALNDMKKVEIRKELIESSKLRFVKMAKTASALYKNMIEILSIEDSMLDLLNFNDLDLVIRKPMISIFNDKNTKTNHLNEMIEKLSVYSHLFEFIINEKLEVEPVIQQFHKLNFNLRHVICNLKILLLAEKEPVNEEDINVVKLNELKDDSQKYMRNILILRHFNNFLAKNGRMEIYN